MKITMKLILPVICGIFLIASFGAVHAELSADEILQKVDAIFAGDATIMETSLTTISANGEDQRSKMKIYAKRDETGKARVLIHYLAPPTAKGTRFLFLGGVGQIWMYSPKVEKLMLIAGNMAKESMMNSAFSYADLLDRSKFSESYTPSLTGTGSHEGINCHLLELKAKKGSAHYHAIKLWVRSDNFIPVKEEFYAGSGKLEKLALQTDLKVMDGRTIPTRIIFDDYETKQTQTVLAINSIRFDPEIPEKYFTKQFLEKGQL